MGIVDRNLLIGLGVAVMLALFLGLCVQRLPARVWVLVHADPPRERARAAWAEPRELDWHPRAAVAKATEPQPANAKEIPTLARAAPRSARRTPVAGGSAGQVAVPAAGDAAAAGVQAAPAAVGGTIGAPSGPEASGEDRVWPVGEVDAPPEVLSAPQPAFPAVAERLGLTADVHVAATVEIDGSVSRIEVRCEPTNSACDKAFLSATRTAVRTWRFRPARLGSAPVRVRVEKVIHFEADE